MSYNNAADLASRETRAGMSARGEEGKDATFGVY